MNGVAYFDFPSTFNLFFSCFERSDLFDNISICRKSLKLRIIMVERELLQCFLGCSLRYPCWPTQIPGKPSLSTLMPAVWVWVSYCPGKESTVNRLSPISAEHRGTIMYLCVQMFLLHIPHLAPN